MTRRRQELDVLTGKETSEQMRIHSMTAVAVLIAASVLVAIVPLAEGAAAGASWPGPPTPRARESFVAEPWQGVVNMSEPMLYSSVAFLNSTFVIVGGCLDAKCANRSSAIMVYDQATQSELPAPLLTLPFPVAGPYAAIGFGTDLYVFPVCGYLFGDASLLNASEIEALTFVTHVNMETFEVNTTFAQLDTSHVRINATCTIFGTKVYIAGGVRVGVGVPNLALSDNVDSFDMLSAKFKARVGILHQPIRNPTVARDNEALYVVGGVTDSGALNRYVTPFNPLTLEPAMNGVPMLPQDHRLTTDPELHAMAYAGFLVVMNVNRSYFVVFDLQRRDPHSNWIGFDTRSEGAPYDLPWSRNLTYSRYASTTWIPINQGTNGSSLLLIKFGGAYHHEAEVGVNETITESLVSHQVMMSVTNVRVPATLLAQLQPLIVGSVFNIPIGDANATIDAQCHGEASPCAVRLSARTDCVGNAAGTQDDVQWAAGQPAEFIASSAATPVFVCFSSGTSTISWENGGSDAIFAVTDVFAPLSITASPPTSSPPSDAPSPSPPDGEGEGPSVVTLLMYISGGVAAFISVVAIVLIVRLRRGGQWPSSGGGGGDGFGGAHDLPPGGSGLSFPGVSGLHDSRYRILSKIGEGAFSIVYLAVRRHDGAKFAMKHMECQSDQQRQDAIKECEIMRSLQGHPNVIKLVDMFLNYEFDTITSARARSAGSSGDPTSDPLISPDPPKKSRQLCLVMEYHPAGDLRRWALGLNSHPPEPILCSIAFQICSVLKHIHSQEPPLIHRDLKPENVLLAAAGGSAHPTFLPIVVTDFGLARMQEDAFCRSGAGTLPYVAPECFRKRYTTQCDIWSLGCVLYAIATRRVNNDSVRLMFQDCTKPSFFNDLRGDLIACGYSMELANFVQCLLVPIPEDRLTAVQAFKLFRKKGELVYISSKVQPPPAAAPGGHGGFNSATSSGGPAAHVLSSRSIADIHQPPQGEVGQPAAPQRTSQTRRSSRVYHRRPKAPGAVVEPPSAGTYASGSLPTSAAPDYSSASAIPSLRSPVTATEMVRDPPQIFSAAAEAPTPTRQQSQPVTPPPSGQHSNAGTAADSAPSPPRFSSQTRLSHPGTPPGSVESGIVSS